MKPIIEVNHISKKYRIGVEQKYLTLRDSIVSSLSKFIPSDKKEDNSLKSGEFWALKNVSFEVNQGEVLGIIGKNGAGKSTILKILSRITPPTEGEINLRGRVASLLEVGTGFHPELTGRENIYLNGAILGMGRKEISKKFNEIIDFSGIGKFIDTPVKRYSSGMYTRLAFAVSSSLKPEIMIVDEVLAVGDAEFQKKCLRRMNDVVKGGRTIIFVSHNLAAIQNLCQRCILLQDGLIALEGKTEDVIDTYLATSVTTPDESQIILGTKDIVITHYEIIDKNGKISNSIQSGDKVIFRLYYESKKSLEDVSVAIGINDESGQRVLSLWSRFTQEKQYHIGRNNMKGYFECVLDNVLLRPGSYYLITYLDSERKLMFSKNQAGLLKVVSGTYYPTNIYPNNLQGTLLTKHSWMQVKS